METPKNCRVEVIGFRSLCTVITFYVSYINTYTRHIHTHIYVHIVVPSYPRRHIPKFPVDA